MLSKYTPVIVAKASYVPKLRVQINVLKRR